MELPTKKSKPIEQNPKFMILFGKPKCGKSTVAAALEDAVIIDLEDGTDYLECMSIKANTIDDLRNIRETILKANKEKGDYFYKYGIIDTATKLEDLILPLAKSMYKATPMGKSFNGSDVRELPNGAGYLYIREAYKSVINGFRPLFKYFILLGHTKDKTINKQGKELSENCLDLAGKLERIISSEADALGYVYRNKNQTVINFNGGGDSIVEARPAHIRGQEIVIAESNKDGKLTFHWDKIFI